MKKYFAWCWSSGRIEFGDRVPEGAIALCRGARTTVVREVTAAARHGSNGTLLVPGVVEATSQGLKADALSVFLAWQRGGKAASRFITWTDSGDDAKWRDPEVVKCVQQRLLRDMDRQVREILAQRSA